MINKIEINAAIDRLLTSKDFDLEAARTIIEFGLGMKVGGRPTVEIAITTRDNSSVQGYASGVGEVEYKKSENEKKLEKTFGIHEERVGSYKLRRRKSNIISIRPFWKADLTTTGDAEENPEVYSLGFKEETADPIFLSIREETKRLPIFPLPIPGVGILFFKISLIFERYIHGEKKGKRSYDMPCVFIGR